jgi:hypothetical protein
MSSLTSCAWSAVRQSAGSGVCRELVLHPQAAGALFAGDYAAAIEGVIKSATAAVDIARDAGSGG